MFTLYLSKWLGGMLLPPLNLALIILVCLWLGRKRPRAHLVAALAALLLIVVSTPLVGNNWLRAMEYRPAVRPPFDHGAQAIVVLGGGALNGSPEWGTPAVSMLTLQRLQYAAWLHRQTGLPLLVTGGKPSSRVAEGVAMALVLQRDFGVPVRWIEDKALDTTQNAFLSAQQLLPAGVRRVYVISHAWHLPRALPQFVRAGLQPVAAPTGFTPGARFNAAGLLPSGNGLLYSYLAAHEGVGRLGYAVRDLVHGRR